MLHPNIKIVREHLYTNSLVEIDSNITVLFLFAIINTKFRRKPN